MSPVFVIDIVQEVITFLQFVIVMAFLAALLWLFRCVLEGSQGPVCVSWLFGQHWGRDADSAEGRAVTEMHVLLALALLCV